MANPGCEQGSGCEPKRKPGTQLAQYGAHDQMTKCTCGGKLCKQPPFTCTGLTHDSGYPAQLRYNWGYAPWVIESWAKASKAHGWDKRAAKVKQNILAHLKTKGK